MVLHNIRRVTIIIEGRRSLCAFIDGSSLATRVFLIIIDDCPHNWRSHLGTQRPGVVLNACAGRTEIAISKFIPSATSASAGEESTAVTSINRPRAELIALPPTRDSGRVDDEEWSRIYVWCEARVQLLIGGPFNKKKKNKTD